MDASVVVDTRASRSLILPHPQLHCNVLCYDTDKWRIIAKVKPNLPWGADMGNACLKWLSIIFSVIYLWSIVKLETPNIAFVES